MKAQRLIDDLQTYASDTDALFLQRFFKTSPGEYGEGDVFIGVRVPQTRAVCRNYRQLPSNELKELLQSPIHEHRLAASIIMSQQYKKATTIEQETLYDLYIFGLDNQLLNNWDIIDTSAEHVLGAYAHVHTPDTLRQLAHTGKLWHQRAAMVACFAWLRKGEVGPTLEIAEILCSERHDLLQKAVGWLLRETGKYVDDSILLDFLNQHAHEMPRTQLRYAIEKLSPDLRRHYLQARQLYVQKKRYGTTT